MNKTAKEGDIVRIKSGGGPVMTVGVSLGEENRCSWWDDRLNVFRSENFRLDQLEVIEKQSE